MLWPYFLSLIDGKAMLGDVEAFFLIKKNVLIVYCDHYRLPNVIGKASISGIENRCQQNFIAIQMEAT